MLGRYRTFTRCPIGKRCGDTYFDRPDLQAADLDGMDLRGVNFSGAVLSRASLRGADLCKAKLGGANFSHADLSDAKLTEAYLAYGWVVPDREHPDDVIMLNMTLLHGTNFQGADLSKVYFGDRVGGARLNQTIFGDSNLTGSTGLAFCRHEGPST